MLYCYSTLQPHAPKGSALYYHKFRDEWREVFFISAEIYIFGAIVYLILGSGKKQPWGDGHASSKTPKSIQNGDVATSLKVSSSAGTGDSVSVKEYLTNSGEQTVVNIQQPNEDNN